MSTLTKKLSLQSQKVLCGFYFCVLIVVSGGSSLEPLRANGLESSGIQNRLKREGFGPWEANEAWDSKGKSNIAPVITALTEVIKEDVKALEKIINSTAAVVEEVVEVLEHPVQELSKTRVGKLILALAALGVLILFLRLAIPVFKFLRGACYFLASYVILPLSRALMGSGCCMVLCALKPFVAIRNWHYKRVMDKEAREKLEIYRPSEEIQMLTKTYSAVHTDENGIYLQASDHHRVYLQPERQTEDFLMLNAFRGANRNQGTSIETVKEAVLSTSKLYKIDKIPDFQGTFEVDGTMIGHFSRIKFNGLDCLLTAYHVLDYNRTGLINLRKGDKCVKFSSIDAKVVAASKTEHLDFLILSVPSCVFSTLGLKVGVWTSRVQPKEPIQICQFFEGKPCVSSAAVRASTTKAWHVNYAASTMVGTSGAPVLDSKNRIVGVHLEYDSASKLNVGVIPPVFRMNHKESPTNEDIAQGQPDMVEIGQASDYAHFEEPEGDSGDERYDEEFEEMSRYHTFLAKNLEEMHLYKSGADWGAFMNDQEEAVDEKMYEKYGDKYRIFSVDIKTGGHIGHRIKGDRYRKESPWTCSKCSCVQKKGYICVRCGYALIRLTKDKLKEQEEGAVAARDALSEKLPTELVTKIMNIVGSDLFAKRVAMELAELLASAEKKQGRWQGPALKEELQQGLYPNLPAYGDIEVPMQKALVQELRTAPSAPVQVVGNDLVTHGVVLEEGKDFFRDGLTAVKDKIVKVKPIKETVTVPDSGSAEANHASLSKSAKRRLRTKKKKEAMKADSAVSLNSKAPAKSGAPTTSGMTSQSLSQSNPKKSGTAQSRLPEQDRKKRQPSGKKPVASTQATQSTHGPREGQKQKSAASSSNATSTF